MMSKSKLVKASSTLATNTNVNSNNNTTSNNCVNHVIHDFQLIEEAGQLGLRLNQMKTEKSCMSWQAGS